MEREREREKKRMIELLKHVLYIYIYITKKGGTDPVEGMVDFIYIYIRKKNQGEKGVSHKHRSKNSIYVYIIFP